MLFANIHRFLLAGSAVITLGYIAFFGVYAHSQGAYESRGGYSWSWIVITLVIVGAQWTWYFKPGESTGEGKRRAPEKTPALNDDDIDAIIARHTKGQLPGTSIPTVAPKIERRVTPERRTSQRSAGFGRRTV